MEKARETTGQNTRHGKKHVVSQPTGPEFRPDVRQLCNHTPPPDPVENEDFLRGSPAPVYLLI